jgi:hypothetical protein
MTNGIGRGIPNMLDTVLVTLGVGFFAVAILYVLACEKM